MSDNSSIEWTDATWNPVRGCSKVSPGCAHCYAETFAERFRGVVGHAYEQGFDLRLVPEKLTQPLLWTQPKMIFVNSMSDLFHEDVPDEYVLLVARVMQLANWHTFQVLTKRSERMLHLLQNGLRSAAESRNIWWGVSVENQRHGLPRVEHLRASPATIRFLSIEPLLENLGKLDLRGIHWVIVGGESGPKARPMKKEWVRQIRDQCTRAKVPFFFKQWGGVRKSQNGRRLDGRVYDEFPPRARPVRPSIDSRRVISEVETLRWSYARRMSDTLPTIWPSTDHTRAKHALLRRYLDAWFPILASQAANLPQTSRREILYIDGFAGPGEYSGGELGSPVIALQAALQHSKSFPAPARFIFIEERLDRFAHLRYVLGQYRDAVEADPRILLAPPRQGDCNQVLSELLSDYETQGKQFGPSLAFLDQFGYSAVSIELVRKIMSYPSCEVLSYLDYRDMNRWISDPEKASAFNRTYGGEEWKGALALSGEQRKTFLLETYKVALRERAGVRYPQSFAMFDENGLLLYWLLFCTNNLRGLEEMKRAMWTIDKRGHYRFSDKDDPNQLQLLEDRFDDSWLAETLAERLAGESMTVGEIKAFVLEQTPCYSYKRALTQLYRARRLEVLNAPPAWRKGSFPDEQMVVRFGPRLLF